jgi:hypothetical protein
VAEVAVEIVEPAVLAAALLAQVEVVVVVVVMDLIH